MQEIKSQIRAQFKKVRENISLQRKEDANENCFSFFFANLPETSKVLSFASLKEEINVWPINEMLMSQGRLYLPRTSDNKIEIFSVSDMSQLVSAKYALMEPDPTIANRASLSEIDVIIVPGLSFDANNSRVGYGSGYYDKLIYEAKKQNPLVCCWGTGFIEQLYDGTLPKEATDMILDQLFLF